MQRVRAAVTILVQDRRLLESCDEGATRKYAKVEQVGLFRRDRKVPSLHLSWRQSVSVLDLNEEEAKQLVIAGYDVKEGDESPYVMAIERKFRHRFIAHGLQGWCISTSERGDNLNDLAPSESIIIPTLDLPPEAGMIIGIHDVFRTLKEDLKRHSIYPEFFPQQERMFQILATLVEDARKDCTSKETESPPQHREVQMGVAMINQAQR